MVIVAVVVIVIVLWASAGAVREPVYRICGPKQEPAVGASAHQHLAVVPHEVQALDALPVAFEHLPERVWGSGALVVSCQRGHHHGSPPPTGGSALLRRHGQRIGSAVPAELDLKSHGLAQQREQTVRRQFGRFAAR
jgi:hypothetical protein